MTDEPKADIGPKHLRFMGVDFLKPTPKNPKSRNKESTEPEFVTVDNKKS